LSCETARVRVRVWCETREEEYICHDDYDDNDDNNNNNDDDDDVRCEM